MLKAHEHNQKRAVWEQYELFKPDTMLIEDHASGTQLLQEFKLEGLTAVQGFKPEGTKLMRLDAQTATIEQGLVHLPKQAPWRSAYVLELTSFPYGEHADQVDSTSQALA